jgi:hypothetical protein
MPKSIENGFASGKSDPNDKGRHNRARNRIVNLFKKNAMRIRVPRHPLDRTLQKQANIITKYLDKNMQVSLDRERAIYYDNPSGIDMIYPHGSRVADLSSLSIISDNRIVNNFNVIVGCTKANESHMTFVALKVSEERRRIEPEKMLIYEAALKGMLMNKPNVIRGSLRNGLVQQYVCHGYRKNPLDCVIGEYAFNAGVSETEQNSIKRGISLLVGEMEEKVMAEMNAANFEQCAGYDDFFRMQDIFDLPSLSEWGIATQFALSTRYCSRVHTDADYFLTTLMVYDAEAEPDEVLYYFCFPTYNCAIPMKSGDIIVFNPLVPHGATNPSRETSMIYSCYVSKKTCNTVVANASV